MITKQTAGPHGFTCLGCRPLSGGPLDLHTGAKVLGALALVAIIVTIAGFNGKGKR
jgi:hypothetical protein